MRIDSKQRKIIIIGVMLFVFVNVFPPWVSTFDYKSTYSERPVGYSFIVTPPDLGNANLTAGLKLDFDRLFLEWLIVLGITSLGVFVVSDKQSSG